MKCFLVYVDECEYDDDYGACVILADSEEEVRNMFERVTEGTLVEEIEFRDRQGEIHIEEMIKKGLVLASFNVV